MDNVFIDTDVILDFMTGREPFSEAAAQLLSLSDRKKIRGCTSGLVFSNAYYILRKLASHQKVIAKLKQLSHIVEVSDLTRAAVLGALDSRFSDFEDALQHYAAVSTDANVIITRNVKDFRHSELAVMTPEQYLSQ